MLGGMDGKTLFAVTAASSDGVLAAAGKTGKIEMVRVDRSRAGRP